MLVLVLLRLFPLKCIGFADREEETEEPVGDVVVVEDHCLSPNMPLFSLRHTNHVFNQQYSETQEVVYFDTIIVLDKCRHPLTHVNAIKQTNKQSTK